MFLADWFQSHYYFERNGWSRKDTDRESFDGDDADKTRVSFSISLLQSAVQNREILEIQRESINFHYLIKNRLKVVRFR